MLYISNDNRRSLLKQQALSFKQKRSLATILEGVSVRATRPRLIVAHCLYDFGPKRVTPDELYKEITDKQFSISLATVYNCLNLFAEKGLLRKYSITGEKTYFDTNIGGHQFFFCDDEDRILPITVNDLSLACQPDVPAGFFIDKVDIIVHLKRKWSYGKNTL